MSRTSTKKKFSFGKLLVWIVVILVALNIITDGEIADGIEDLYYEFFERDDYVPEPKPAYMGVTVSDVEGITGAYISAVTPGSPAATAGLMAGDVIVTIGDRSINTIDAFIAEIDHFHAYDSTMIVVLRNGNYLTLNLTFGEKIENNITGTTPGNTSPGATTPPVTIPADPSVDLLPSVPAELRNHVYLNARGWGYCEKLTGNVVATVLFVSDPDAGWSDGEIENAKSQFQAIADQIVADAGSYGAAVNLSLQYKAVTTSQTIVNNETADWMASALAAAGLPALKDSNPALESTYGADAAPVIFIANHGGRAFASSNTQSEYAILYQDTHAFYHELSHVFGAKDFYYPADVKDLAETYLPGSIMVSSSQGAMDDLTAYLIGWTDTLTDNALAFLKETSYLTKEYLAEEHAKETYTGYVTDFTYDGGSYTGYLVFGVKHGEGKWIRDDGTIWEGTFNHGSFTGNGNIIYSNGDTYDGQWTDGRWHGTGTYKWANGGSYTGAYVNGERTGHGIMAYSDGARYEGSFLNGKRHGQGTMQYADGASYVGQWADGVQNGQGKLIYANGAVYEGNWLAGKRHGKGTHTNANGDTYVGDWADGKRNGQGTLSYANGNIYTGSWADDTWNGEGTFTWTSGDKYTGAFADGKRHGYGIYYYPNGNRYEGNWVNGERHGQGTMYYANGSVQSGVWENGKFKE